MWCWYETGPQKTHCYFSGLWIRRGQYLHAAYRDGDDNECNIHGARVEEGTAVGDIDTTVGTPLSHFNQRMLLQLQQVQFELNSTPLLELYGTTQSFQLYLEW